jgi:phosphinothricin acetyltransferase
MDSTTIRIATAADLESINEIYNQAVLHKLTADTTKIELDQREEWFKVHDEKTYPVFVYIKYTKIVGWLSFSPYRLGRQALKATAEISYYLEESSQKKGIGTALVNFAKAEADRYNFKNLFAIILENNHGSVKLMQKCGFEKWGFLPKVANFEGKLCGQVYYGINL